MLPIACSRIGTESKRQSQSGRRCRAASHNPPAAGAPSSRVPGGRAGRGARATQRRLAAALATEAATPGGRTGLGSRATPYVPTGEPPMLMARLVCPRQSPWSASGGVFARKKLFDGGIRSAGLSHLSSVGSSGPVGHTVYDEALLERRQIDSVGSCAAVTSKCPCVIYWNAEKIRY
jgi:hypothetical protein